MSERPTVETAAANIAGGLTRIIVWSEESPSDPHVREGEQMLEEGLRQALWLLLPLGTVPRG